MSHKKTGRERRKERVRKKISGTAERPRMSVFRSLNNISVQIVDDEAGKTLAQASTYEKGFAGPGHKGNRAAAKKVGETIAERAKAQKVEQVVFDRSGYIYHGCVKELADAARQKGLKF
jgi:large subunit ribosomal protein L18